jgi:hypothetical protein
MDITTLAAWGEFLGGIAVVVSLIYLAGQIRQNSRLLKASAAGVTWQSSNAQASLTVQDPELARIYWAGIADRESLSEQDRQRFDPLVGLTMTGTQQQLRLARDGILTPEVWSDVDQGIRWNMQRHGIQQWWRTYSNLYSQEFRDYVDGLIREGEAAG